jgi:hypothetical protein
VSEVITFDTKAWNTAIGEYADACKKTYAYAMNRQLNNVAVQSLLLVKEAKSEQIQNLTSNAWWPKLIAKIMKARVEGSRAEAREAAGWGKKLQKVLKRQSRMKRFYSRKQAQAFSAKVIRKRLAAVTFLRGFFAAWSLNIKLKVPKIKGPALGSGQRFLRYIKVLFVPATENNLSADISVAYDYKTRKEKTAIGAEKLLKKYAELGYPAAIADMKQFTEQELLKHAARHSAR